MAVAFNNGNTMVRTAGGSTSTAMSVTAGGSNVVAIATVAWDNAASLSVTAITYGGSAMTSCGAADNNGTVYAQAFYLVNPPTGSNTLAITVAGGTVADTYCNLVSFTGVNQTTPVRPGTYTTGGGTATGGTSSYTLTVTSNVNDVTFTCLNGGALNVVTSNQTRDGVSSLGTDSAANDHCTTPATSVAHTWSVGAGGSSAIAIVGFSVQAVSAGFTAKLRKTLSPMGTGVGKRQIHDYSH